jgi:hypothetical protein
MRTLMKICYALFLFLAGCTPQFSVNGDPQQRALVTDLLNRTQALERAAGEQAQRTQQIVTWIDQHQKAEAAKQPEAKKQ